MLILTRKVGEQIKVGNGIDITVLEARHGRVRIGIAAPAEIPIRRGEIPPRSGKEVQPSIPTPAGP